MRPPATASLARIPAAVAVWTINLCPAVQVDANAKVNVLLGCLGG